MDNRLKIIKARVEQDKYATVELKIIKADGKKILKDLYVEKELNDGEFYVVSDNVLVALHRTLRSGEVANLQLLSSNGDVLVEPLYSRISQVNDNIFVCVKAASVMDSVKNNQNSKTDALKVQEIALDSRNIKNQMTSTMKANNQNANASLRFVFEDAYNEAIIYKIDKVNGEYDVKVMGDGASFVAIDDINIYSHSNVVQDLTKVEAIGDSASVVDKTEEVSDVSTNVEVQETTPVEEPVSAPVEVPEFAQADVQENVSSVEDTMVDSASEESQEVETPVEEPVAIPGVSTDDVYKMDYTPVDVTGNEVSDVATEDVSTEENTEGEEVQAPEIPTNEINYTEAFTPVSDEVTVNNEENNEPQEEFHYSFENDNKEEVPEEDNNFAMNEVKTDNIDMPADISNVNTDAINNLASEEESTQTFDNFFGLGDNVEENNTEEEGNNEKFNFNNEEVSVESEEEGVMPESDDDQYDQLSTVISKLISRENKSREIIAENEERIRKLEEEVENKTKKVNTLINENRKFIDENRALKNRVNGLEAKTARLEEENHKYMMENRKLKDEARRGKTKINAFISSIDEVLDSYNDNNKIYTKVA